jgi:hypothetical protein
MGWIRLDPMDVKPVRTGDGCGWGIGTGTEGPLRHGADETVPCPVSGSGSNDAFASERDGRGCQRKAASTDRKGQDRPDILPGPGSDLSVCHVVSSSSQVRVCDGEWSGFVTLELVGGNLGLLKGSKSRTTGLQ